MPVATNWWFDTLSDALIGRRLRGSLSGDCASWNERNHR